MLVVVWLVEMVLILVCRSSGRINPVGMADCRRRGGFIVNVLLSVDWL
jgi:hypothetical protein